MVCLSWRRCPWKTEVFCEHVAWLLKRCSIGLMSAASAPFFTENPWSHSSQFVFPPPRNSGGPCGNIQASSGSLFEFGDGDTKSLLNLIAIGFLYHHLEKVDLVRLEQVLGDHDLVFPSIAIIEIDGSDRIVPTLVTVERFQGGCDVTYFIRNAEVIEDLNPRYFTSWGRVSLWENEGEHLLFRHGKGGKIRADGAVDPA